MLKELQSFARDQHFTLESTPTGIRIIPLREGRPLSSEEFGHLSPQLRQELEVRTLEMQEHIADTLHQIHRLQQEANERVRQLDHDVARFTLGPHLEELRAAYTDQPKVLIFLDQVLVEVLERLDDFRSGDVEQEPSNALSRLSGLSQEDTLARYRVNVFVASEDLQGAPVVVERNPTYYNLLGRIDYRATLGALVTDFRQMKRSRLHLANGGFLMLHVLDVLRAPFAWEALKRSLLCSEVTIENLGEQFSVLPTEQLRPEPIPLDVKVILLGPPEIYALLYRSILTSRSCSRSKLISPRRWTGTTST